MREEGEVGRRGGCMGGGQGQKTPNHDRLVASLRAGRRVACAHLERSSEFGYPESRSSEWFASVGSRGERWASR